MRTREDLVGLAEGIIDGKHGPLIDADLDDFRTLYDHVLKKVEPDVASVTVALFDGLALASFPHLSSQLIRVKTRDGLSPSDFAWPSSSVITVVGGTHRGAAKQLLLDVRDAWALALALSVALGFAYVAGLARPLATAVAPTIALASGLFFAVFVLFGMGEVTKSTRLQRRLFSTGQLQRFLDADRYLVRLATWSFTLALVTVGAAGVLADAGAKLHALVPGAADFWSGLPDAIVACLLWSAALATGLCLRAVAGYLVDRAAGTLLLDSATEATQPKPPADRTRPAR
jgi:hypothetical protein